MYIMFGVVFVQLLVNGVFCVTGEMKTLSVMEGDSVTLHANFTEIQRAELITWTFGADGIRIAQINNVVNKVSIYEDALDGRFRDRLKLDEQTGSLTIADIVMKHAGVYQIQTFGGNEAPAKTFSIIVSTHLPVPVLIFNFSQCSSSSSVHYCSVLCSVVNVSAVSLSWNKGNSVLSSISVSDLSISLSLPLEVEYQDSNTYSCVIDNPISNQTTHLDISTLCQPCSAPDLSSGYIALVICFCAVASVLIIVLCGVCYYYRHHRRTPKQASYHERPDGEEFIGLTNGVVSGNSDQSDNASAKMSDDEEDGLVADMLERDEITSVPVMVGHSATLNTGIPEIQHNELVWWTFAEYREIGRSPFVVIAEWDKTNNKQNLFNGDIFKDVKLNQRTGSLTITKITQKHFGYYKLCINSEGQRISKTFSVVAKNPWKRKSSRIERRQTSP
ncbi:uncharacterized protein isoform X3 [Danio rerio]|uniref:Uncharacterized protein isoform X3 n=3 Tax=Danio rerio TaxID=7955 RepID=A0A8M3AMS7_DANRE|nr:uncharacterized protein LOC100538212 [Danio rerio]|eukprot:XP_009294242.1 uncharacterized protein LOC100538212 [Danio rerio]